MRRRHWDCTLLRIEKALLEIIKNRIFLPIKLNHPEKSLVSKTKKPGHDINLKSYSTCERCKLRTPLSALLPQQESIDCPEINATVYSLTIPS